jgi:hypothetical protein
MQVVAASATVIRFAASESGERNASSIQALISMAPQLRDLQLLSIRFPYARRSALEVIDQVDAGSFAMIGAAMAEVSHTLTSEDLRKALAVRLLTDTPR